MKLSPARDLPGRSDILDALPHAVAVLDAGGRVRFWNRAAADLFGWEAAEMLGRPAPFLPAASGKSLPAVLDRILQGGMNTELRLSVRTRGGLPFNAWVAFAPLRDPEQPTGALVAVMRPAASTERFSQNIVDALPQHIAILDEHGDIIAVNRSWREFAEANQGTVAKTCEGSNYLKACQRASRRGSQEADAFARAIRAVMEGSLLEFSLEYPCHSPLQPRWFMGRVSRFGGTGPARIVVAHENITELRQAQDAIQQLAFFDTLTGLPNRLLLEDRIEQALAQGRRDQKRVGIVFLDLDRFKAVNDRLGHSAGDRLLRAVAERLRDCVRKTDTVARLSGDEFIIVLPALAEAQDATPIVLKILVSLGQPFDLGVETIAVSSSLGVALYPQDGDNFDDLIRHADMAMYRAKEDRSGSYCFFGEPVIRTAPHYATSRRRSKKPHL